jgi:uncharacterized protein (DUF849 family)
MLTATNEAPVTRRRPCWRDRRWPVLRHSASGVRENLWVLMKACVNGARGREAHPALPVTAADLATDVAAVAAAGADAVHLHVKDSTGADTLYAEPLAEVLTTVRRVTPGMPLGVTTGAWALPDPADRVAAVRSWTVLPDFASVNWHESGAAQVAAALLERGIGVEAGLWHDKAVDAWQVSPMRDYCLRVLLELPDGLDEPGTAQTADRMLAAVHRGTAGPIQVLLHGEGSSCWPALRYAARHGLPTRIGLEDTLQLPEGSTAHDNAALVRAALQVIRSLPAR